MTVREILGHLEEMYGTEISPSLISAFTDAVSEEVKVWQSRPLEQLYPIFYLDCIHVKVRDSGAVRTKAIYLAIGVNMEGHKEVLGLGSLKPKVPSFACKWSQSSRTGVCRIFSLPASMASKAFPRPLKWFI